VADVRRARDHLGWQAATSLAEGLALTLGWYANAMAAR
jgi:nucleoside-diphosphate-sugar epimerase